MLFVESHYTLYTAYNRYSQYRVVLTVCLCCVVLYVCCVCHHSVDGKVNAHPAVGVQCVVLCAKVCRVVLCCAMLCVA